MRGSPDADRVSVESNTGEFLFDLRKLWWLRLFFGLVTLGLGVAVLVWPEATLRVAGVLFGLYLVLSGLFRLVASVGVEGYTVPYRVFSAVIGLVSIAVGVVCLRNLFTSAILLAVFVALGWLFEGIAEIIVGALNQADPLRWWRIGAGAASGLAALIVLIWPVLSLATFVILGGVILVVLGLTQVFGAVGTARART